MNQATQHISSDPALDFANAILAETNGGLELIEILHDIAQGIDERATTNDRITAANILADRGLGKCPKQPPAPNPNPAPEPSSHKPKTTDEPESPRLVTQIKDALQDSLGPTPSTTQQTPLSTNHSPLQTIIQQHILEITNNGQTIRDTLEEIARAKDDPKVKPCHRARAARILLDRLLGTAPASFRSGAGIANAPDAAERDRVEDLRSDEERWAKIEADLKQMEEAGILTPDPDAPPIDISNYRMPKDFDSTPYEEEEFASFKAEIELRVERQKQWPEIEERRRKKLAQIYPSHTDGGPPDT